MSDKRLLDLEEQVYYTLNSEFGVNIIKAEQLAKTVIARTAEIVRAEILGELERGCNHWDRDWHNFAICSECVQALKEGRKPE